MKTVHLCCGLGGSLWTGAILGWNNIYALDNDQWRCDHVKKQAEAGYWPGLQVECADLESWKPPSLDGELDLLAAGFSCRDISTAGRGEGLSGKSSGPTYRGCLQAIDAWRPAAVFFENSPAIRKRGRIQVTADLVARGYRWRDGVIAASDVGAPHIRKRWFLLAIRSDVDPIGWLRRSRTSREAGRTKFENILAHALRDRLQIAVQRGGISETGAKAVEAAARYCNAYPWNPLDPRFLRVVYGVAAGQHRGRRIAGLGDAWVPLQAATAFMILSGGENAKK